MALPGFMQDHPAFKTASQGGVTDNGSSFKQERQPSLTPKGAKMGIVGANARASKRKAPRTRMNHKGGKVKDC